MAEDKYFSKENAIRTRDLEELGEKDFEGSSPPAIFVGSKLQYPKVNIGVLSTTTTNPEVWKTNNPRFWTEKNLKIEEIINLRKKLINSRTQTNVGDVGGQNKILHKLQEIGMACVQPNIEINLYKKPYGGMRFHKENMPLGKAAELANLKVVTNTKIPAAVDKVHSDTDLKSREAIKYLYKKGFGEGALTQLLSIGVTGIAKNRKLVPTRNSITAIDDTLGKELLGDVKDYSLIDTPRAYFGGHLGNYYLILLLPEIFSYELYEMYTKNNPSAKNYSTDYEGHSGRKNYAEATAGGYYAARLPLLEKLKKIRRQAAALILRFITPEYTTPMGVWVCRNASRKTLEGEEVVYETVEEMLTKTKNYIQQNFQINIEGIYRGSKILTQVKTQTKLGKYF